MRIVFKTNKKSEQNVTYEISFSTYCEVILFPEVSWVQNTSIHVVLWRKTK